MNLSVKNMIFAFAVGLVVFSLIMTAICVAMFNAEIEVAQGDVIDKQESVDMVEPQKTVLYSIKKTDGTGVNFAVLVMIDSDSPQILLTPIYNDYLIPYKNALSYVGNVYSEQGDKMFPEAVKAFSGILIEESDVLDVEGVVNYEGFKSVLLAELSKITDKDLSAYTVKDFTLILKETETENTHEQIKQVDTEKSVAKFKNILG